LATQANILQKDVVFRTYSEGDAVKTDPFLCYLKHNLYELNKVAILDQTAFGHQSEGSKLSKRPAGSYSSLGSASDAARSSAGAAKSNTSADSRRDNALQCRDIKIPDDEQPIYLYYPRGIA
jgi:hypothetical protein